MARERIKTMKRTILSVLLVLVMTLSFTGCKQKEQGNTAEGQQGVADKQEEPSDEPVEIRFTWWGNTDRDKVYNEICDRFEKEYTNITVIREPNSWGDYWNKLATQVAGGNAPDMFGINPYYAGDYAGRNVLEDLQPYIDSGIIDTNNMSNAVVEGGKWTYVNTLDTKS